LKPLAVIAGFGGINAAGSSGHHGYRRSVIDVLDEDRATATLLSLAALMRIEGEIDADKRRHILEHTLVRGLERSFLDPARVPWNLKARLSAGHGPVSFTMSQRDLPPRLPTGWTVVGSWPAALTSRARVTGSSIGASLEMST
jgi:acetoacetyl-[acyl-carrier protein] synthase